MNLATRTLRLLPAGTLAVGAGLAVLGAGSYAHLAVAGHSLSQSDPTGIAALSVLWAIVFWLGLGLFFPVEQELIRHVAARRAVGEGIIPVVRRGAILAGGVLAATLVPLAAAARPLARSLFGGDVTMVAALAAAFLALAVVSVSRGVLAGMGRFNAYGCQLAIDGGLRIVFAGILGAAGIHSAALFGLILAAAPLLSAVLTAGPMLRDLHPGPPIRWSAMCRGLGFLVLTMLLAQFVVNIGVINIKLLSPPGRPAVVGALLAATILARIPLFVFTALQASLLPDLAGALAVREQSRFWRLVIRGSGIVTVLAVAGGLPTVIFGPWLIHLLFNARPVLGPTDFALLTAGTLFYMLAMVLGQGAMAMSRHREQLFAWIVGTVVLVAITVVPGEVKLRVEGAYSLSSLTVALVLAILLRMHRPRDLQATSDVRMMAPVQTGSPG
jgi:O-antigen/teichoic acid export membrane protein